MVMTWLMRLLTLADVKLGSMFLIPQESMPALAGFGALSFGTCIIFFIAIARVIVNDDGKGSTAPDPLVWCSGAKGKRRRVIDGVRDFAMIPGPQRLWVGSWFRWPDIVISGDDVGCWPFSVGALVNLAAFLSSLSWPSEVSDLGPGGVSYVELVILYERWAGERLRLEDSIPKYRRPGRPISVSAAPLCPDVDIWKLCKYFGTMRALCRLPRGFG